MKHTQFSERIIFMQAMNTLYLRYIEILMNNFDFAKGCLIIFVVKPVFLTAKPAP